MTYLCAKCREMFTRDEMIQDEGGFLYCRAHAPKVQRGKR